MHSTGFTLRTFMRSGIERRVGFMKKKISKKVICGLAAAVILVLAGAVCGVLYQRAYAVACVISLDINPSIELELSRDEKVLSCTALNEEAAEVLSGMDGGADLKNTELDVAVNAIMGALVKYGYMNGSFPVVLISVEDNDQERAAQIRQELIASVTTVLQEQGAEATVFSQILAKDTNVEQQARQNNISIGKAALANRAVTLDNTLKFEQLAGLSLEELIDAGSSAVSASANTTEIDPEQDKNSTQPEETASTDKNSGQDEMTTQPEGTAGTEGNSEQDESAVQPETAADTEAGSEQGKNPTQPTDDINVGDIGEAAAKNIALEHAGLSESQVTNMRIERDYDRNRLEYELEFWQETVEYEYTIDGSNGMILECKKEPHGDSGRASVADNDIGEAAAQSIALSHAGLSEAQTTNMRVHRNSYGDTLEYEVKFKQGTTKYEYIIDGSDGEILKYEWND